MNKAVSSCYGPSTGLIPAISKLFEPSFNVIIAQRLVRTICPNCIDDIEVKSSELAGLGFPLDDREILPLKKGKGCNQCRGTGYSGRCGIFEIFPMSDSIKKLISSGAQEEIIKETAIKEGMTTLTEDAWNKILNGITTFEEAVRITGSH